MEELYGNKIGTNHLKNVLDKGIHDDFMRGAVSQRTRRNEYKEENRRALGNWEEWRSPWGGNPPACTRHLDYYLEH